MLGFGWQVGKVITAQLEPQARVNVPSLEAFAQSGMGFNPAENTVTSSAASAPFTLLGSVPKDNQAIALSGSDTQRFIAADEVATSKLNLKLHGIISLPKRVANAESNAGNVNNAFKSASNRGVAIIKTASGLVIVGVNETIQPGVELDSLYPDYVVIRHRGALEKLVMDFDNSLLKSAVNPDLNATQPSQLSDISNEIKQAPLTISRYVRFEMVNEGTQVVGIKVWPRKETALFNQIGFQAGDVLKTINGVAVSEMVNNPQRWQALMNQTEFSLSVERNGQTENFSARLQ
ncbi:type II secretion system protein N [Thiomicrorhabdus aquaedulcis]|uniref:type II secretion system protein N n=1 Tax=Thiomicrorhabdus aquaedulcis TaxID=2211106 RepID=UPI0015628793|nr:type II secretion system protein N [Thiomicrorhabdus aquaedulcis]